MKIEVKKITGQDLLHEANSMTTGRPSKMSLRQCYRAMHSNMRTQLFWIKMFDIKLSAASHFVRHIHAQPFQRSKRPDRDPNAQDLGRNTPTDLGLLVNAEEIVNISEKRLCFQASTETREIWQQVIAEVAKVDPDLAKHCVPQCMYRGGICPEPKGCGYNKTGLFNKALNEYKKLFT